MAAACADLGPRLIPAHNVRFAEGMGTSIATGVAAAPVDEMVVVATCDMPAVDAAHVRALIARSEGGAHRVASSYSVSADASELICGVPACFPIRDRDALLALHGDRGARDLLRNRDTVSVALGDSLDLDTPEDVARWQAGGINPR